MSRVALILLALLSLAALSACPLILPPPTSCSDGRLNGDETDLDCGGSSCGPCLADQLCLSNADCASTACTQNRCIDRSCTDGLQNGEESDVDCGGPCPPCGAGRACRGDVDCAGSSCLFGRCVTACAPPLALCPGAPTCTDTMLDPANCGGCGAACPPFSNAASICLAGACQLGPCAPRFANCNVSPVDGCEADLAVDPSHCGQCGHACSGPDSCTDGRCCQPLPAGTYTLTCVACEACEGTLRCLCPDAAQNLQMTSIPLTGCVNYTNCNGVLLCQGC